MSNIQVGTAQFDLAVNSAKLVSGLNQAGAGFVGFVDKTGAGSKQAAAAFGRINDTAGSMFRSFERSTRSLRGVSEDMQRSTEKVYQYEGRIKSLNAAIETAKQKVEAASQAEKTHASLIETRKQKIAELEQGEKKYADTLAGAKDKLQQLTDGVKGSQAEIDKQNVTLALAETRYNKLGPTIAVARDKLAKMNDLYVQMPNRIALQTAKLNESGVAFQAMTAKIDSATNQYQLMIARQKTFAGDIDFHKAKANELAAAHQAITAQLAAEKVAYSQLNNRNFALEIEQENNALKKSMQMQQQLAAEKKKAREDLAAMRVPGSTATGDDIKGQELKIDQLTARTRTYALQQKELQANIAALRVEEANHTQVMQAKDAQIAATTAHAQTLAAQSQVELNAVQRLEHQEKNYGDELTKQQGVIANLMADKDRMGQTVQRERDTLENLNRDYGSYQNQITKTERDIQRLEAVQQGRGAKLVEEREKLQQLTQGTAASSDAIEKQQRAVERAEKAFNAHNRELSDQKARLAQAEEGQGRYAAATEQAKSRVSELTNTQKNYQNLLSLAKDKVREVAQKEKERADGLSSVKEKTKQAADSQSSLASASDRVGGSLGRATGPIRSFNQCINESTAACAKWSFHIATGVATAVGTFAGNVLSSAVTSLKGMVSASLDAYSSNELLAKSYEALMERELKADGVLTDGTAIKAEASKESKELLSWTQQLAIASPFGSEDISNAFKTQMAYGLLSDQAKRLTTDLVDMASAQGRSSEVVKQGAEALSKMYAEGKLTTEAMNEITGAGVNVRDVMSQALGVSTEKLQSMVEAGIVPADLALEKISESMEKDFGGAAQAASGTMSGLLNSLDDLKNMGLREFFSSTFETVKPLMQSVADSLGSPSVRMAIEQLGDALGTSLGNALNWLGSVAFPAVSAAAQNFVPYVLDAFGALAAIASEAYSWGAGLGEQFGAGLQSTVDYIVSIISWIGDTISYWMQPHSPPKFLPDIDKWGKETAEVYLSGWTNANFSALDAFGRNISDVMQSFTSTGAVDDKTAARTVLTSRNAMVAATNEMRLMGSVSEQTFKAINAASGPIGDAMERYARAMFATDEATRATAKAQERLNAVTKQYDAQLGPLQAKLAALENSGKTDDRAKRIAELQKILKDAANNPLGMGYDPAAAKRELEKLTLEAQIDVIQQKRDAETSAAEKALGEAQEREKAMKDQLDLQQQQIDLVKEQNKLVAEQIDLQKQAQGIKSSDKTPEEQAKEDAQALQDYNYQLGNNAVKLGILNKRLAETRHGSKEYYDLLLQIKGVQESAQSDAQKTADQAKDDAKAQEEYNFQLGSKSEKLSILRRRLDETRRGSKDYFDVLLQIKNLEEQKEANADEEQRKKDAEAQENYNYQIANTAGKLELMQQKLGKTRHGSAEYFDTLLQIKQLEEQRQQEAEKSDKSKASPAKKMSEEEQAAKAASDAQFDYQMSIADTDGKLALMQQRLAGTTKGSAEYYKTLQEIDQLQKQRQQEVDKEAKSVDKLSDAEFQHNLKLADKGEQEKMLEDRLASLTPGTQEYMKTQEQLQKVQEDLSKEQAAGEKQVSKLSKAEFEAQLATQDRAGKIKMLHERIEGLDKGTKEYYDTLKQLNNLEREESSAKEKGAAGGGGSKRKAKGKGVPIASMGFKGASELGGGKNPIALAVEGINEPLEKFKDAQERVSKSMTDFKSKLEPVFQFFRDNGQIIGFILEKIAMKIVLALVLSRVIPVIMTVVEVLRGFLTVGNLVSLAIFALGLAWKVNFGGIQDITFATIDKIRPLFAEIGAMASRITDAFNSGGLGAAFAQFLGEIPNFLGTLGQIFATIGAGIWEWIKPVGTQVIAGFEFVFNDLRNWITGAAPSVIITGLQQAFAGIFSKGADNMIILALSYMIGGFTEVFTSVAALIVGYSPALQNGFSTLLTDVANWISAALPRVFSFLGISIGLALTSILEALVNIQPALLQGVLYLASFLLKQIPGVLGGLVDIFIVVSGWILNRGIPLFIQKLGEVIVVIGKWFRAEFPGVMLSIGQLIGNIITKLAFLIGYTITNIVPKLPGYLQAIVNWIKNEGLQFLYNIVSGIGVGILALIGGIFIGMGQPLADFGRGLLVAAGLGMENGINTAFSGVTKFLKDAIGGLIAIIHDFAGGSEWGKIAINILEGLRNGLNNGFTGFLQAAIALFDRFVVGVKTFLGIQSPSTVFAEIGTFLIQGLIDGISAMGTALIDGATAIFGMLVGASQEQVGAWAAAGQESFFLYRDMALGALESAVNGIVGWLVNLATQGEAKLLDFKTKAIAAITNFASDTLTKVTTWVPLVVAQVGTFAVDATTKAQEFATNVGAKITEFIGSSLGFLTGWATDGAGKVGTFAINAVAEAENFRKNAVEKIGQFISSAFTALDTLVRDGVSKAGAFATNAIAAIEGFRKDATDKATAAISGMITQLGKLSTEGIKPITDWVKNAIKKVDEIKTYLEGLAKDTLGKATEVGKQIVAGVKAGIGNAMTAFYDFINDKLGDGLVSYVMKKLHMKSPSRKFMEIGTNIVLGMVQGIEDNQDILLNAASNLGDEVYKNVKSSLDSIKDLYKDQLTSQFNLTDKSDLDDAYASLDEIEKKMKEVGAMVVFDPYGKDRDWVDDTMTKYTNQIDAIDATYKESRQKLLDDTTLSEEERQKKITAIDEQYTTDRNTWTDNYQHDLEDARTKNAEQTTLRQQQERQQMLITNLKQLEDQTGEIAKTDSVAAEKYYDMRAKQIEDEFELQEKLSKTDLGEHERTRLESKLKVMQQLHAQELLEYQDYAKQRAADLEKERTDLINAYGPNVEQIHDPVVFGLINGIANGLQKASQAMTNGITELIKSMREQLGIHSPSRVFDQIGGFMMKGLEEGLVRGGKDAILTTQQMTAQLAQAAVMGSYDTTDTLGAGSTNSASSSREYHLHMSSNARESTVIQDFKLLEILGGF